jgi:hypothetical protein
MKNILPDVLRPLKDLKHWVIWRYEDGRKVPYRVDRPLHHARVNVELTWGKFKELIMLEKFMPAQGGIGFMLLGSGIGAIDLDDCRDSETGRIASWARELIDEARSYVEVTPSQCGLRIIGHAVGAPLHTSRRMPDGGKAEFYRDCPRFITVTGDQVGRCDELANIDALLDRYMPAKRTPSATVRTAVAHNWRDVIERYGANSVASMVKARDLGGVDRSRLICSIACKLFDRGASVEECAAVIEASTAFAAKFGGRGRTAWDEAVKLREWWERQQ